MTDLFAKWRSGLAKSSKAAFGQLATLFGATDITQETWDDLEALLIQADLGIESTAEIMDSLKRNVRDQGLTRSDELSEALQERARVAAR
jgi:fused signal recognition particle receptor